MVSRRNLIGTGLWSLAGAGLGGVSLRALPAYAAAAAPVTAEMLTPDVALLRGAGGNVLAVSDGRKVTLVDGGAQAHTGQLLDAVASAFPGQQITTLFNTHWHPQQTGANATLAASGTNIISHANTRLWLTTDVKWPWGGHTMPLPRAAWPAQVFYNEPLELGEGAARAVAGYMLQGHTDGDAYVYFPEADVLHCGGVLAADRWPEIDWWTGGWLGGLAEATETLLAIANDNTRIVAADGPVFGRAELLAQRDMYTTLFVKFRDELLFKGLSPEEAVAAQPTREYRPEWGDPGPFVNHAFQSLWGYFAPDA
ncbi:MAG: MBL fold metallo-hydrolase [Gammaproteobacteria bacterium]|nr:MBL fold metallo-hydrolase [Gammaproteobacteria bacterium]